VNNDRNSCLINEYDILLRPETKVKLFFCLFSKQVYLIKTTKKMKKIVLFLFVAIATLSVKAQDLYMGGTVGLWRNDDANTTSFKLAPEIGYNLSEQWALGVELQFNHEYKEHISTNTFAIAPYARFSYYENKIVRLFVDGGFGFATTKVKDGGDAVNGFEIGLKPGIAIKLNQHFSLVAKCGFLGYKDDYMGNGFGFSASSEDLTFGFHYEF
jgi:hypothetical protein